MFYNKKYAFNRYNIVCKISNIRVERKKSYWIKCWQTLIILSPSKCLNNQNISPLPTHGLCHCGQFQIPVVSSSVNLGGVAMKNRASACRDCTFSCVLFKTRRPYAVEVEVSTTFRASGPWRKDRIITPCSNFEHGVLYGMESGGVISSK